MGLQVTDATLLWVLNSKQKLINWLKAILDLVAIMELIFAIASGPVVI